MRWPIQFQLLLPTLSVVVLAIVLASGVSLFRRPTGAPSPRGELQRVVATLAEAKFPLSEPVLRQMSGLSGAEFVLLDQPDTLQASTLRLSAEDLELLQPNSTTRSRPANWRHVPPRCWEGGST